jgi:hypothetical protein
MVDGCVDRVERFDGIVRFVLGHRIYTKNIHIETFDQLVAEVFKMKRGV